MGAAYVNKDLEDILVRDNAYKVVLIVNNREAANFFVQHHPCDISNGVFAFDGDRVGCHDILGLHFGQKIVHFMDFKRTCLGRGCAFDITVGKNAYNVIVFINNRKTSDVMHFKQLLAFGERSCGQNRNRFLGHPVSSAHWASSVSVSIGQYGL